MKTCPIDATTIDSLVQEELILHPHLEPVDLYKLLYQALYGPFHIVRDFTQLCAGISQELELMQHNYQPYFQKIGHCYTRLSLSAINRESDLKQTNARVECLARWVLNSCVLYEDVRDDFWQRWQAARDIMQRALPADFESWNKADGLAEKGLLPSHSALFHAYYDPHYRLVDASLKQHRNEFLELNK